MQIVIRVLLCALIVGDLALDQEVGTPEEIIERMLTTGTSEGHDQKVIGVMGDAASVTLTRIVADRPLNETDIDMILFILRSSFADPNLIAEPSNRKPRTTLFLLRSIACHTKTPDLQKKISATREAIVSATANAARPPGN